MKEKKYIKMSLGTAICLVIITVLIIALIALGIYTYSIKNTTKETNYLNGDESEDYQTSQAQISNSSTNTLENVNDIAKTEKLNVNDSLVKSLIEKISFNTYATASIYKVKTFTTNNVPNDLILRLGWDKSTNKLTANDTLKQTLTKDGMKQSIANIFGNKINYEDKSFNKVDVATFHGYEGYTDSNGMINYSNGVYTTNLFQGGGGDAPFIYQELQKAQKSGDKVEIYVKTAFIDTRFVESTGDFEYEIYKNFNFNSNNFEGQLSKIEAAEFAPNGNENISQISLTSNEAISKVSNNLNTYVYTFEKDNAGEYYFNGFSIK